MNHVDSLPPANPAQQHKALTAAEQSVIKKLFRRLIIFLFVLFVFSFLDRINIGFAELTMGKISASARPCSGWRRRCSMSPT